MFFFTAGQIIIIMTQVFIECVRVKMEQSEQTVVSDLYFKGFDLKHLTLLFFTFPVVFIDH